MLLLRDDFLISLRGSRSCPLTSLVLANLIQRDGEYPAAKSPAPAQIHELGQGLNRADEERLHHGVSGFAIQLPPPGQAIYHRPIQVDEFRPGFLILQVSQPTHKR